jgi:hypothetical protein
MIAPLAEIKISPSPAAWLAGCLGRGRPLQTNPGNLLGNAVKFTPDASGSRVRQRGCYDLCGGPGIRIIGRAGSYLQFHQVASASATGTGGLGLSQTGLPSGDVQWKASWERAVDSWSRCRFQKIRRAEVRVYVKVLVVDDNQPSRELIVDIPPAFAQVPRRRTGSAVAVARDITAML